MKDRTSWPKLDEIRKTKIFMGSGPLGIKILNYL